MSWINYKYNIGDTVFRLDISRLHKNISPSFFIVKERHRGSSSLTYKSFIKNGRSTYSFTTVEKNLYSTRALLLEKSVF